MHIYQTAASVHFLSNSLNQPPGNSKLFRVHFPSVHFEIEDSAAVRRYNTKRSMFLLRLNFYLTEMILKSLLLDVAISGDYVRPTSWKYSWKRGLPAF